MSSLISLDDHRPMDPLFTATIFRKSDGSIFFGVMDADQDWLDSLGDMDLAARFELVADLLDQSRPSIDEQIAEARQSEGN